MLDVCQGKVGTSAIVRRLKPMSSRACALTASVVAMSLALSVAVAEARPTYRTCVKAAVSGAGSFNDANCSIASGGLKGEGKYELGTWEQATKKTFTGKASDVKLADYVPESQETFWTGGTSVGAVLCRSARVSGEVTGPSTSIARITFKGCSSEGKKCTTPGERLGNIQTERLNGVLGAIEGGVGMLLEGGGEGTSALEIFGCEGILVTVSGSVIGVVSQDVSEFSKASTLSFAINERSGQEVVFGEFPDESELVFGPGTGAAHVLSAFVTPPGVRLPSSQSFSLAIKGEKLEILP